MSDDAGMSPEEAEMFARGLYYLANVDEMSSEEEKLIREFLEESKAPLDWDELAKSSFSAVEAAQLLGASFLRRIFLKTAIVLIRADGKYTDEERQVLGEIADAFGVSNAEFGALEQAAQDASLA